MKEDLEEYTHKPRWDEFLIGVLCAGEGHYMLRTILIIIVVLALLGSLPTWPYSAGWGYYPSGGLGLILLIVILLVLFDRL
jgi:hypothetical protein